LNRSLSTGGDFSPPFLLLRKRQKEDLVSPLPDVF